MSTSTPSSDLFGDLDPEDREIALALLRVQLARRRRQVIAASKTKRCPTCATLLPTAAFARDSTRRDGLRGQCRDCGRRAREARLAEEAEGWV